MKLEKGFTLIEVMLTVVIIAVGLFGVMIMFENAGKGALKIDSDVIATNLAREKLERIVFDKVISGYSVLNNARYPSEGFGGDYSIFTRTTDVIEVADTDLNEEVPGGGYKRINVTVSWGVEPNEQVMLTTILGDY